jgi:tetratricopeptide (TPR) repeat protein
MADDRASSSHRTGADPNPSPTPGERTAGAVEDHFRRGVALRSSARIPEAIDAFADALLLDASHLPSLLAIGEALAAAGRMADAERAYRRACALYPGEPAAVAGYHAVRQGAEGSRGAAPRFGRPAPGPTRPPLVVPPRHARSTNRRSWLLPLLGFAVFGAGVAAYIGVGLATHFVVGLAAAFALIGVLSGVTLFFSPARRAALRALGRGMGYGLALLVVAALLSIAIALATAT